MPRYLQLEQSVYVCRVSGSAAMSYPVDVTPAAV